MNLPLYKNFLWLFVLTGFFGSCTASKENYYSYNVDRYTVDSANHMFGFSSLLSYGNYLFEYKITTHFNTVINGPDKPVESVVYDTTGIYLLSGKSKQYCEFDTFAMQSKIISKGPFSAKPTGAGVSPVVKTTADSSGAYYGPPQVTSMNHIQCYYSHISYKDQTLKDSIDQGALIIKNKNFNSLYKIRGIEFTDTAYCVIGFRITRLLKGDGFVEQINNLRRLTEKEIRICKRMVSISGL